MALVDNSVGVGGVVASDSAVMHNSKYTDLGEYHFSVDEHCVAVLER